MDAEKIHPCANEQLEQIRKALDKEQEHDRLYHPCADTVVSLLTRILDNKRGEVANALHQARLFQEDVLTFLRAFELMLETVASASTHGEKAARLRGLMELVSSAASKVRDRQFKEMSRWSYSMAEDIFRCDYPVRHWMQKAREAEKRAKEAEEMMEKISQ